MTPYSRYKEIIKLHRQIRRAKTKSCSRCDYVKRCAWFDGPLLEFNYMMAKRDWSKDWHVVMEHKSHNIVLCYHVSPKRAKKMVKHLNTLGMEHG